MSHSLLAIVCLLVGAASLTIAQQQAVAQPGQQYYSYNTVAAAPQQPVQTQSYNSQQPAYNYQYQQQQPASVPVQPATPTQYQYGQSVSYTGAQPSQSQQAGGGYGPASQQYYQQVQQQQPAAPISTYQQPQQQQQQQYYQQQAVTYAPAVTPTPLVLPEHPPTLPTVFPSMMPTPPPMPYYDPAAAAQAMNEPYTYNFDFAPGSPPTYCSYGVNPVPQYNTNRKRCIPYHPMCGLTFTCIFDIDPRTGYVVGQAKGVKK